VNPRPNNLKVWAVSTGQVMRSGAMTCHPKDQHTKPLIAFTDEDEFILYVAKPKVLCRARTSLWWGEGGGIHASLGELEECSLSLSRGPDPHSVAVFETRFIKVYRYLQMDTPTAEVTLPSVNSVDFLWNPNGTMVIAICKIAVDAEKITYGGDVLLHLIHTDGSVNKRVTSTKSGPFHDVQWDPTGDGGFITIAGREPPRTTLYNASGTALYVLCETLRNTISWSPHGRFFVIAQFGGVTDEVDFWDRHMIASGTGWLAKVRAHHHPTVHHEWSPDSRYFMTATLVSALRVPSFYSSSHHFFKSSHITLLTTPFPRHLRLRLRLQFPDIPEGNGYQIFKFNGGLVFEERVEGLTQASWRPRSRGIYPDRPQSP
jgi:uncharacterized protein with WD repeat